MKQATMKTLGAAALGAAAAVTVTGGTASALVSGGNALGPVSGLVPGAEALSHVPVVGDLTQTDPQVAQQQVQRNPAVQGNPADLVEDDLIGAANKLLGGLSLG